MLQNIHYYFISNAFYEKFCAKLRQLEIHLLIQRNLPKTHAVSASFLPFQNSTTVLPSCLAYLFILTFLLQHNPNVDLPAVNELSVVSRLRNLPRVTTFLRIAQAVANRRYCDTWSKYVIIRSSFCCSKKVRKLHLFSTKVAFMRRKLHLCAGSCIYAHI